MTEQIYPCLWFDGTAKEAADFYVSIFKHSKITIDTPMVVNFELNGHKCMGLNGGPMFTINPSISFFVVRESNEEINELWEKLSQGGKVLMPIDTYEWSERYGWIQDKFGMSWQLMFGNTDSMRPSMLFTSGNFGRAEEAIQFYISIFENSVIEMQTNYPEQSPYPGKLMYAEYLLNQKGLIAMDGPGVHDYTFNEGVSFVVNCETQDEIDYYWNKLTEGGEESMCGWLKDKFGVSWQIVPSILGKLMSDTQKGPAVIHAFLKMKKFDIATLLNV